MHLTRGTDELHFYYDAQGKPAVVVFNGTAYGYLYNLQGDVIALVDGTGAKVVEYSYDAWGLPTGKTGSLAGTLGTVQPFRYRGYVFDEETGDYYLRSRYYRTELERFLGVDYVAYTLLAENLFRYCGNNPVIHEDQNGRNYKVKDPLWDTGIGGAPNDKEPVENIYNNQNGNMLEQIALFIIRNLEIRSELSTTGEFEFLPGIVFSETRTYGKTSEPQDNSFRVVRGTDVDLMEGTDSFYGFAISGHNVFGGLCFSFSSISYEIGLKDRSLGVTVGMSRGTLAPNIDIGVAVTYYNGNEYSRHSYAASVNMINLATSLALGALYCTTGYDASYMIPEYGW